MLKTTQLTQVHAGPDGTKVFSGWQIETDHEITLFRYTDGTARVIVANHHNEVVVEFDVPE